MGEIPDLELNDNVKWLTGIVLFIYYYYGQFLFVSLGDEAVKLRTRIADSDDDATVLESPHYYTGLVERMGIIFMNFFRMWKELANGRTLPISIHESLGFVANGFAIVAAFQYLAYETDYTTAVYDWVWVLVIWQQAARIMRNFVMYNAVGSVMSGFFAFIFQLLWTGSACYLYTRFKLHHDHNTPDVEEFYMWHIGWYQIVYVLFTVLEFPSVILFWKCHAAWFKSEDRKTLEELDEKETQEHRKLARQEANVHADIVAHKKELFKHMYEQKRLRRAGMETTSFKQTQYTSRARGGGSRRQQV
jgi:hypothetical protein